MELRKVEMTGVLKASIWVDISAEVESKWLLPMPASNPGWMQAYQVADDSISTSRNGIITTLV